MYIKAPFSDGFLHLLFGKLPGTGLVVSVVALAFLLTPSAGSHDQLPEAAISFTFDNGHRSVLTQAYPILEEQGMKGVVYATTSFIGNEGYLSWEELKTLQEQGWEIGSHTLNNPDLTKISQTKVKNQLSSSKNKIESHGLKVFNFASPRGKYDDQVLKMLPDYYLTHRRVDPPGLNPIPLPDRSYRFNLRAVEVTNETPVAEVMGWMQKAKQENKWLILIFHKIGEEGPLNWEEKKFEKIVQFAEEEDFKPLGVKQSGPIST